MASDVNCQMRSNSPKLPRPSRAAPSTLEVDSKFVLEEDSFDMGSASITSSIMDYEFENGRRYHAYKAGHYPWPNDEVELDRLDLQHHLITMLFNGNLHLAPLQKPKRILDVGTGTGIWAIEMADLYPEAVVIGTDLSPVQPTWVPDNVQFEIDDAESDWTYREDSFDYIHSRYLLASIAEWKEYIQRAFRHCKPGGFFEIQELDPRFYSDDGSLTDNHIQSEWGRLMCEACDGWGKPVPEHNQYKKWFEEVGFVDVQELFFKIPINAWPKNKQLKEIGKFQLLNYYEHCEGLSIALFTRILKWQPAEVQVLMAKLRAELKDRNIHSYEYVAVVYGRKPEATDRLERSPGQPGPEAPFSARVHDSHLSDEPTSLSSEAVDPDVFRTICLETAPTKETIDLPSMKIATHIVPPPVHNCQPSEASMKHGSISPTDSKHSSKKMNLEPDINSQKYPVVSSIPLCHP